MNPLALRFDEFPIDVVTDEDGAPWFVGRQVCKVLGIRNSKDALGRLDDDERRGVGIADLIGRVQEQTTINEPGIYSLILRSRKPEAKRFKRWVTHEVLPQIRRTGSFRPGDGEDVLARLARLEGEVARMTPGRALPPPLPQTVPPVLAREALQRLADAWRAGTVEAYEPKPWRGEARVGFRLSDVRAIIGHHAARVLRVWRALGWLVTHTCEPERLAIQVGSGKGRMLVVRRAALEA